MKRLVSILLAIVVIAGCMSLVACGKANKDVETQAPTEKETIALEPSTEVVVSQTETKSTAGKKFKDVAEYLADPTVKEQLDKTVSSLSSSDLDAEVVTEGTDTLVYKYTYKKPCSAEQITAVANTLDSSLDSMSSMMESTKNEIIRYTEVANPVIKMYFYTVDGNLIIEKSW